jgi:hypothetical protein
MAEGTFNLTANISGFEAGLNQAERKAQSFESRVAGFFKRDPTQRAERAFTDLATNLSSGNVAQGVGGFFTSITAGGLAIGTAVGIGVTLFQKLKAQIDATKKSADALFSALNQPLSAQAALGPEGITAQISAYEKAISDVAQKRKGPLGAITEFFAQVEPVGVPSEIPGAPDTVELRVKKQTRAQEGLAAGFKRIHELRLAEVEAEKAAVNIRALALGFSEKEAALEQNRVNAEQRRATLRLKFGADSREAANLHKELQNVSRDEKLSADEIKRKAALKDKELDIEADIAAQALLGVSTEDQKISKLKQQLALIQEQLKGAEMLTAENRKQLEGAQTRTKAELAEALKARGPVTRPPIGIAGETPQGIYDPLTGEFRTMMRPQEVANIQAGQAEAANRLAQEQMQYADDLRGWGARYADYLRGAEYYTPEQLKRPQPPPGYDISPITGEVTRRPQEATKTQMTKEEFQSALDAVMGKYWGG